MAHSLSAKKRVRQGIKRNALNRHRKALLKTDLKGFTTAIAKGDAKGAAEAFKVVSSRLDKVASKHAIHKNAAARRRSRLAKKVNALSAAPKVQAAAAPAAPKAKAKASKAGTGTKA